MEGGREREKKEIKKREGKEKVEEKRNTKLAGG